MQAKDIACAAQLLAILFAPWYYGASPDPARYALAAVLLFSTAAWFLASRPAVGPVLWPAGALVAWPVLQLWAAPNASAATVLDTVVLLASYMAVLICWCNEADTEPAARRLAVTVLIVCGAQAVFGVGQAAHAPQTLYGRDLPDARSPFGSFENHNHFAGLMEMGVLVAMALAVGRAKRAGTVDPRSIMYGGLGLLLAATHLASRSRGGLLALLSGGLALAGAWWLGRRPGRVEKIAVAAVLASLVVFAWTAIPAPTRAHLMSAWRGPTDASGAYRVSMAGATLRLWRAHALAGSGLGTYEDAVTRHKRTDGLVRTRHAESDVLENLAEGGVVGVALGAWLAAAVLRGFLDRMRHGRDPWRRGIAIGAVAACASLLAHSLVDFNLRIPSNALVFWALAGLAAAPRTPAARRLSAQACVIVAGASALFGVAAAWRSVGALAFERAVRSAAPQERLAKLSTVVDRHPYVAEYHRHRAHTFWALAGGGAEIASFRRERAMADIEQALRLRPLWSYAWSDLGWLLYMQGQLVEAEQAFARAVELDPPSVAIGVARAEFFARIGKVNDAREELRRVRRYNLDWPEDAAMSVAKRLQVGSLK
jgi:O-antigen ligase